MIDDLLKKQNELQEEGKKVLDQLGIIKILSKYGSPKIVGSFETGLMVWRDIDIELVKEIKDEEYWESVNTLFYGSGLKYLTLIDFRNSVNPNTPKGLYIGIKYWFEDKEWKIDVWFLPPRSKESENMNEWIKDKLNNENRKTILEIKSKLYKNMKYRKNFFNVDIYRAVISEGVTNLEGFKRYLENKGINLD